MVTAESCNTCAEFRREILERYDLLLKNRKLQPNGFGVSIKDISSKYIPDGISFQDAEKFLSRSGFEVHKHPGPGAIGSRPDRYDVYAISSNLIPSSLPGVMGVRVTIGLRPKSPDRYDVVESSIASISITSL